MATLDVHLEILHGSKLILRNVSWHVWKEKIGIAIIVRFFLEYLVCEIRTMLKAACDRHDGKLDITTKIGKQIDEEGGRIAAIFFTP